MCCAAADDGEVTRLRGEARCAENETPFVFKWCMWSSGDGGGGTLALALVACAPALCSTDKIGLFGCC